MALLGCDAAARGSGFRPRVLRGCWAVGTTLKRRMQTTPFLCPSVEGAVAALPHCPSSSISPSPGPDAHPPPHPTGKSKITQKRERETASDKATRRTEQHHSHWFQWCRESFCALTSNLARLTATRKTPASCAETDCSPPQPVRIKPVQPLHRPLDEEGRSQCAPLAVRFGPSRQAPLSPQQHLSPLSRKQQHPSSSLNLRNGRCPSGVQHKSAVSLSAPEPVGDRARGPVSPQISRRWHCRRRGKWREALCCASRPLINKSWARPKTPLFGSWIGRIDMTWWIGAAQGHITHVPPEICLSFP